MRSIWSQEKAKQREGRNYGDSKSEIAALAFAFCQN